MMRFYSFSFILSSHTHTLRLLCGDFGEEGHLGHCDEGKPQQLQEHPDNELAQLQRKAT